MASDSAHIMRIPVNAVKEQPPYLKKIVPGGYSSTRSTRRCQEAVFKSRPLAWSTLLQNFTEKTRSVIAIDWQPGRKGVVAVACRDPRGADQRAESAGVLERSSVLIYDFTESIVARHVRTRKRKRSQAKPRHAPGPASWR